MTAEIRINLPQGLHAFVHLLLRDAAAQAELGAIAESDAFIAAAGEVAGRHGVALDLAELRAVLRPDPLGLGRFMAAPIELGGWPPLGWLPCYGVPNGDALTFDWLWLGSERLTFPFFADEARRGAARPLNWLMRVRTSLEAMIAGAEEAQCPSLPLQGLIFHMSRCGSTLLAQMLGAVPGNAVLSEPAPLDEVLMWAWRGQIAPEAAALAVRSVVAALGRQRGIGEERLFIKTDAWHTRLMPLLHAAFPDVPWLYLFRDPLEVLASHRKQPGIQTVSGTMADALFGIEDGAAIPPLDFTVTVLNAISGAAIEHRGLGRGLFVEYSDLVARAPAEISAHFGQVLDERGRAAMVTAAGRDSKSPDVAFAPDGPRKRAESPEVVVLAARHMAETHQRLQALSAVTN